MALNPNLGCDLDVLTRVQLLQCVAESSFGCSVAVAGCCVDPVDSGVECCLQNFQQLLEVRPGHQASYRSCSEADL